MLWTRRGVSRQGRPLSPSLFTFLMADLENELKKAGWRRIKIGERKIYLLAYADDGVTGCGRERNERNELERYLEMKDLELNINKTKIMR